MNEDSRTAGSNPIQSKRRAPPGAAPGTMIADPEALQPVINVVTYGATYLQEKRLDSIEELTALIGQQAVTWVNVDGLGDVDLIRQLGEIFGLHRLALEDVVNVYQRPKVEEYDDHIFIVTRMPELSDGFSSEQITLFLGKDYVLTFQERPGDCADPVRERIRRHRGRIRNANADYLAYALLDAVIDAYFPVLEHYGEIVESLETEVIERPTVNLVGDIHEVKRDLLSVRRALWPQREMLNTLIREESPLVQHQTQIYLRDCYDHTVQLLDMVETYREIASGLIDIYLSSVSTHMNEIMKVLTIIATIFIPLGFIAGVYGMNFNRDISPWNMPELDWYWGYPFALGFMLAVALVLVWFFYRRGWIGKSTRESHVDKQR